MRRKLIMSLGLVGPLLIAICLIGILVTGSVSWWLLKPKEKGRPLRIAPLAPLATLMATPTAIANQNSAAPVETPPAVEPKPNAEMETPTLELTPTPTPEVEEILDFQLPPGSVNSATQAGAATRLVVPKLELDAPVIISPIKDQTWQVDHLGQAVGHLEGTAPPGSNSNIVLAGHITLAEGVYGPFAGLGKLGPGDPVVIYQGDQKFNYVIEDQQIVERTSVEVTFPTDTGQITLITCNNWNSEAGRYEKRLIVRGRLVTN